MVHSSRTTTTANGALQGGLPSQGSRIPFAQASQKNKMDGKKASGSSLFFTKRTAMLFFVLAFIFLKHQEDFRRQDVNAPLQLHKSIGRNLASAEVATPSQNKSSLKDLFQKKEKKEKVPEVKKGASGSGNKAPSAAGNKAPSAAGNKGPSVGRNKGPSVSRNKGPRVAGNKAPSVGRNKAPTGVENKAPTEVENKAPTEVENKAPTEVENKSPTEGENKSPTEGENKSPTEGENKSPTEGENKSPTEGENKSPTEGENKAPTEGENKAPTASENKSPSIAENKAPGGQANTNNPNVTSSTSGNGGNRPYRKPRGRSDIKSDEEYYSSDEDAYTRK
ncbi:Uncharacterized protein PCOAH_00040510 [Plasmodium coatneyi]|uniref:Uncharacterized protein n=1 Tax=Plasmodium coatneyi TaxID=208452 RepID=A0A1B1E4D8_9APIC|nr:Uncharacterized protein PCOAH_00040510 [Plasmodium coatneyi]ANQ09892.1 Uncharacterized protein PCOAH_00040510 [Plasmodium coatneyi]